MLPCPNVKVTPSTEPYTVNCQVKTFYNRNLYADKREATKLSTGPGIGQAEDCSEARSKLAGIEAQLLPCRKYPCDVQRRIVRQNNCTSVNKLQDDLDCCNVAVGNMQLEHKVLLCTVVRLLECGVQFNAYLLVPPCTATTTKAVVPC